MEIFSGCNSKCYNGDLEKLSKKNEALQYSLDVQKSHYEHLLAQKIEKLRYLEKEIENLKLQNELSKLNLSNARKDNLKMEEEIEDLEDKITELLSKIYDTDTDNSETETYYTDSSDCSGSEITTNILCDEDDDKKMVYIEMLKNHIKLTKSIHDNAFKNINDDNFFDAISSLDRVGETILNRTF